MKLLKVNFFSLLAMVTLIGLITSCTKTTPVEPEINKAIDVTQDTELTDVEVTPVLSKTFDEGISTEEADVQFGEMVDNYINNQPESELNLRGKCSVVYIVVQLNTSNQANSGTTGTVTTQIRFRTDKGGVISSWMVLDKPWQDRHRGSEDYYLVRVLIPSYHGTVCWAELDYVKIALKGTDDWLLKDVRVAIRPDRQVCSSVGLSNLKHSPYTWMKASAHDKYDVRQYYGNRNKIHFCY